MTHPIYYSIGDIHGEFDKLQILHGRIKRHHAANFIGCKMCLIHLGDYVDRGPDSCGVVRLLMDMEKSSDFDVINLKGNHEVMMIDGTSGNDDGYRFWTRYGGLETLQSYRSNGFSETPSSHISWMKNLKTYHWDQVAKLIFVHAGIDPARFPADGPQKHLWTRTQAFFDAENWESVLPESTIVVHGHTPTKSNRPDVVGTKYKRINVDTGACYGGDLTAVILAPGASPQFLSS